MLDLIAILLLLVAYGSLALTIHRANTTALLRHKGARFEVLAPGSSQKHWGAGR